ncbi:MAG: hypothetical protein RBS99_18610 [Rhodospirillales bacterium]|jgi:hypothetical protein|nr:hypothetical protein [Rhodospirillales bacterium]
MHGVPHLSFDKDCGLDDLIVDEVAARLRKTARWVKDQVREDERRPPGERALEDTYYRLGRTLFWTETGFLEFKEGLKWLSSRNGRSGVRVASRFGNAAAFGTWKAPSAPGAAVAAFAEVQAFRPTTTTSK